MSANKTYSTLAAELSRRASRAYASKLGIVSEPLRAALRERLERFAGEEGSFLSDPVFEATFGWKQAEPTMRELAGRLLHPRTVEALDGASDEVRFGADWKPFSHQLETWEALAGDPAQSVVVTSGTGSGKTECFMVPILDGLVREAERSDALQGVRAIFLYPLNALINSQRDRLRAWTAPLQGDVRFCLYNGNTPDSVPRDQEKKHPEEVQSREALRRSAPPILVTNATMLEYMLVRQEDAPIIEQSKGLLRWIVLDEAHTYVGSQAAEMALLLRRVLHAFDARPEDVRFVATSATIGKSGDGKVKEKLAAYLADIAGVPQSRVVVVEGFRDIPALPADLRQKEEPLPSPEALEALGPQARFERLAAAPAARRVRKALAEGPCRLSKLEGLLYPTNPPPDARKRTLKFLDDARTAESEHPFLPLRGHFFHRTQVGVWACINPSCSEKSGPLDARDWPFGTIFFDRRQTCRCGSLVFELALCNDCGAEYLRAEEQAKGGLRRLVPTAAVLDEDDVDDEEDPADSDDEFAEATRLRAMRIVGRSLPGRVRISPRTGSVEEDGVEFPINDPEEGIRCGRCGRLETTPGTLFLPLRAGGPFFLGVAMPTLLEQAPPAKGENLPFHGKRAITFSDSRSGSAEFALHSQLESERYFVRTLITHYLHGQARANPAEIAKQRATVEALRQAVGQLPALQSTLEAEIRKLGELENPRVEMSWAELVQRLSGEKEIRNFLHPEWKQRTGRSLEDLADFLLFREFSRRPRRLSSLETLGFVKVVYPQLEEIARRNVPSTWRQHDLDAASWAAFLSLGVDLLVRGNVAIVIPPEYLRWFGARFRDKSIIGPDAEAAKQPRWALLGPVGTPPLLGQLLLRTFGLQRTDPEDRAIVNEVLREGWSQVLQILDPMADGRRLDIRRQVTFARLNEGWICPITRRVLPAAIGGYSPFLNERVADSEGKARPIRMPQLAYPFCRDPSTDAPVPPERVEQWLETDPQVDEARAAGIWTEFSDRLARRSELYLVKEHSAQLSASLLEKYERAFKEGKLNLLSCSTTMEMGVDIGGLSVVGMNNAPPGPANFLQRAGRAGRRKETAATTLTMCKSTPHGEEVFRNPLWPFETPIHVPSVSLHSARIVERHLHSLLLTRFFQNGGAEIVRLTAGWFFGDGGEELAPSRRFEAWLRDDDARAADHELQQGISRLVSQSSLSGHDVGLLLHRAADTMAAVRAKWLAEWQALAAELARVGGPPTEAERSPAQLAIWRQMERMSGEYLLGELSTAGFLPAYGFPTGVVPFVNTTKEELDRRRASREREEPAGRRRGYPSRQAPVAIREYAPGARITIDGKVYKSSGITLNWQIPASDQQVAEIQAIRKVWRCSLCGSNGTSRADVVRCSQCGRHEGLSVRQFLQPAGFAVDFLDRVGNDLSQKTYVPVERPWISVNQANWVMLSRPEAGRYRVGDDGQIFHHTKGLHGAGFAVCLKCGRAASETSTDSLAELPTELKGHYPLRGGRDRNQNHQCTGNDNRWAIKRHLWFGTSERTNVFELQLHDHETGLPVSDDAALSSIAVALRQALAEKLGIDDREIGWAVQAAETRAGGKGLSILLFDTAAGGAGYVNAAPVHLVELLRDAKAILDCKQCDHACHACLLAYDTQFEIDRLHRKRGHAVLSDALLDALELPASLRFFGEETQLECEPLPRALDRELQRAGVDELRLYLAGKPEEWDPIVWPLRKLIWMASERCTVTLVVERAVLEALPREVANDLASFLDTAPGVQCAIGSTPFDPKVPGLIAEVHRDGEIIRWATTCPDSRVPAPDWAALADDERHVVGRSEGPALHLLEVRTGAQLRKLPPGTLHEVEIHSQADGHVGEFGKKLWEAILASDAAVRKRLVGGAAIEELAYEDRYLCSPLAVRLLREFLGCLAAWGGLKGSTKVSIQTAPTGSREIPNSVRSDWLDSDLRRQVTELALAPLGAQLQLEIKQRSAMPHARQLAIRWSDGAMWKLKLDEGIAFVRPTKGSQSFDFHLPPAEQAARLLKMDIAVGRNLLHGARFYLGVLEG